MISVALFDIFIIVGGAWSLWRVVTALRTGVAHYQTGRFDRREHAATFWIVVIGYLALVFGAIYGVAVGAGL